MKFVTETTKDELPVEEWLTAEYNPGDPGWIDFKMPSAIHRCLALVRWAWHTIRG